jgi:hypothetical protein
VGSFCLSHRRHWLWPFYLIRICQGPPACLTKLQFAQLLPLLCPLNATFVSIFFIIISYMYVLFPTKGRKLSGGGIVFCSSCLQYWVRAWYTESNECLTARDKASIWSC